MMDRRQFLKIVGAGAAATTLSGCASKGGKAPAEVPADKMTYRLNPKTGEKVSLLGYGCMRWPFITAQDGGSSSEAIDQQTVNELVDYALAHGVNYFDTAPFYCRALSEKATGTALKRHPRDSYYIATKMSNMGVVGRGLSPKETFDASMQIYRNSFESLQTDYIDYYLLHAVGTGSGLEAYRERFEYNGLLDFLLAEREAGRIRNLGFSFHGDIATYDYLLSLHEKVHWDFGQIQFNYVDYTHGGGGKNNAQYLYSELEKRGIPAVVMEPLLGGRLAGLSDHLGERLQQRRPQESVASWAFRFAGTFPGVLTVLSGMTYMEHLQDNIRTYSPLDPCSGEELELLENTAELMTRYPTVPCTACQYCMPCPYGIDIPGIFAHYNKCVNEGYVSASSRDENYRKARRAFLVGYDRSVPLLRQASHCIGCERCVSHCPQGIKIPSQLHKIDHYVEKLKRGDW